MSKKLYFLITFVLALTLSGAVQAEPNDANLIGWWKFDEAEGNTVEDSSIYNNDGVTNDPDPIWSPGYPGDPCDSAMDFDGVGDGEAGLGDYVVCARRDGNLPGDYPAELMPDTFTIACWTRLDSFTYYGGFVSNGYEDGRCGFFLNNGGNAWNFGISMMTNDWWDVETPTPVKYLTDRWHHLAATYDGQYAAVYVNGELAAEEDVGGPIRWITEDGNHPSNFIIGSWKDEGYEDEGFPVDGIIDDVRFYNYALSVNDIRVLAGFVPGAATNPSPRWGADDVPLNTDLSWTPGTDSNSHDVYFGTDEAAVDDANTSNTALYPGVYRDNQPLADVNYDPGLLDPSRTYYWRIDEVNETADTLIKGKLWSFTTGVFLVVDDFEPYVNDTAIEVVWTTDHLTGNGAELFLETSSDYVINGNSMRYYFRNITRVGDFVGSEAEADIADLEIGSDWTASGVKALVLYFYGDATNLTDTGGVVDGIHQDQMYVALEDGDAQVGIVKYPDMNDINEPEWHEWNIDLQDPCLADVNLADVAKVYIGFGGQKVGQTERGAGDETVVGDTVWFDDIRLYPPRCVEAYSYGFGDITGDCNTDLADVLVMSDDWLVHDYNVTATEPCDANLVGWWKFDEGTGNTVEDSSAYNNNGVTVNPTPSWVGGYPGDPCDSAMYFNGITDYVVCAERVGEGPGTYPAELMPDTFTIACWVNLNEFVEYAAFITSGNDYECGFFLYSVGEDVGDFALSMYTESGGWVDVMPTNIHETDTWYHLAVSYDGQYVNFYVDGILIEGPQDVGGPIRWIDTATGNFPNHFIIGSWEDPAWQQKVYGIIDEVRFYNHALQQGEIAVLAGLQGTIYLPLDVPANLVPKDPCDSEDPNLGTNAFDPNNIDIINFRDYAAMAEHWLEGPVLWPPE